MWYNGGNPSGGMIFLNNHVLGISWHVSVETAHKILPTLYILQGKTSPLGACVMSDLLRRCLFRYALSVYVIRFACVSS